MSGICGFVSQKNITMDELVDMNRHLGSGLSGHGGGQIFVARHEYLVGMSRNREPLYQPVLTPDGRLAVILEGSLYNRDELCEALSGYPFRSRTDEEIILASFLKWDDSFAAHLDGMFVLALYDRDRQMMYLVRDRMGECPLYYELERSSKGCNLYFASTLKALMSRRTFRRTINRRVLSRYFMHQYINAPDTVFEQVYQAEPGSILSFSLDPTSPSQPVSRLYADLKTVFREKRNTPVTDRREAKEEVRRLLTESVKRRMKTGSPVGICLDGGIESALLAGIACGIDDTRVRTFSLGISPHGEEIADCLGVPHTHEIPSEEEVLGLVPNLPRYYDEPFADPFQMEMLLLARLEGKTVKACLNASGADELFGGRKLYTDLGKAQLLDPFCDLAYRILCRNYDPVRLKPYKYNRHNADYYRDYAPVLLNLPLRIRAMILNRNEETKTQFSLFPMLSPARNIVLGENEECFYGFESSYDVSDWPTRRMLLDLQTSLPGDLLTGFGRAGSGYGLAVHHPYIDRSLMEYVFRIPRKYLYSPKENKRILTELATEYLPEQLLEGTRTRMAIPFDQWLKGPLKQQLLDMCSGAFLKEQGLFDRDFVKTAVGEYLKAPEDRPMAGRHYGRLIWSYFVFQQWYEEYFGS